MVFIGFVQGHRAHTMYVGLHVPGSAAKKKTHHRRHRHHHRQQQQPGIAEEGSLANNGESAASGPSWEGRRSWVVTPHRSRGRRPTRPPLQRWCWPIFFMAFSTSFNVFELRGRVSRDGLSLARNPRRQETGSNDWATEYVTRHGIIEDGTERTSARLWTQRLAADAAYCGHRTVLLRRSSRILFFNETTMKNRVLQTPCRRRRASSSSWARRARTTAPTRATRSSPKWRSCTTRTASTPNGTKRPGPTLLFFFFYFAVDRRYQSLIIVFSLVSAEVCRYDCPYSSLWVII